MRIVQKSGYIYDFNKVKAIEHKQGVIIVIGNFKPYGRYQRVFIALETIEKVL
jgi:hypothetical protein